MNNLPSRFGGTEIGRYKFMIALRHLLRGGKLKMAKHTWAMDENWEVGIMYSEKVIAPISIGVFTKMVEGLSDDSLLEQTIGTAKSEVIEAHHEKLHK